MTMGLQNIPPVLDACCGSRMFWFDKQDDRALFVDKRRETWPIDIGTPGTVGRSPIVVDPDEIADFTNLPYPDATFALVVFDPPHIERTEAKGLLTRKYGHLTGDWRAMLRDGFAECFRVLVYHAGHIAGVNEGLVSCERGAVSKVTEGRVTICQYTRESQYGKVLMKERVR